MDAVNRSGLMVGIGVVVSLACGGIAAHAQTGTGGARQRPAPCMGHGRPSPESTFSRMDANHDGSVSKAEFEAFEARRRAHDGAQGRMGPPPDGMGPPPEGRMGRPPCGPGGPDAQRR